MLVVFVDDEPGVLHGIERMLFAQKVPWNVYCVPDPHEALELIDRNVVDVVVADLKMPKLDGPELLRQVRERHPDALRIVLSAAHEPELLRRAFDVAHGFLVKPCTPGELVAQIERGARLKEQLQDAGLRRLANDLGALPPAPVCWLELNRLLADDRSDVAAVAAVVGRDPGLAAKVLQLCNSAYYAAGRSIVDIASAVIRLGFATVREVVLLAEAYTGSAADAAVIARGQREAAMAARLVGRFDLAAPAADIARTAALLAGIGDTLLARQAHLATEPETMAPALGAYLLTLWNLPPAVVEAVALRERPLEVSPNFGPVAATHIAMRLVRNLSPDVTLIEELGLATQLPAWRALLDRWSEQAT